MSVPASAHPRLSPSGLRVVAGEKVIVVDRTIEIGPGTSGQWADEERLYYTRQPDGAFVTTIVGSGRVHVVRELGFNNFSARGLDHWAGYRPGEGTTFSNGVTVPAYSDPALSDDRGVWAARVIDGGAVVTETWQPGRFADRDCSEIRYARQALAWMTFIDGRRQVAGRRHQLETPTLLSVEANEGWPVPFSVGDQLWLLTLGANRLLLRPWGETHGYVVATGDTFEPDAAALPDGRIHVVWDAGGNVLGEKIIAPNEPRLDLRGPIVVEPPRPPDPPIIPPVDPPKETPVAQNRLADVERIAAVVRPDLTTHEGADRFTGQVAATLHFGSATLGIVGDANWGRRRNPSGILSDDVIQYRSSGENIDFIPGAGSAGARLGWSPSTPGPWVAPDPDNVVGGAPPVDQPPTQPTTPPSVQCRFQPQAPAPVDLSPALAEIAHLRNQLQGATDRNEDLEHTTRAEVKQAVENAVTAIITRIDRGVRIRFAAGEPGALGVAAADEPQDERSRASRILAALEALLPFLRVLAGRDVG